jgi:hypothetical protein
MANWLKKVSKKEAAIFLKKYGKKISSKILDDEPKSNSNQDLKTKKVFKYYFEGEIFQVTYNYKWLFHKGNGMHYGDGFSGKKGKVVSITIL